MLMNVFAMNKHLKRPLACNVVYLYLRNDTSLVALHYGVSTSTISRWADKGVPESTAKKLEAKWEEYKVENPELAKFDPDNPGYNDAELMRFQPASEYIL